MKIILTTVLPNLESEVDPRFGRGAYYLIVDPQTLEWQAAPNPAISASGGAGVQAAQFVAEHGCSAVISGDFGPNAYDALKAAGVAMYQYGSCRTVQEAIKRFRSGLLQAVEAPSPAGHQRHGRLPS